MFYSLFTGVLPVDALVSDCPTLTVSSFNSPVSCSAFIMAFDMEAFVAVGLLMASFISLTLIFGFPTCPGPSFFYESFQERGQQSAVHHHEEGDAEAPHVNLAENKLAPPLFLP